GACDFTAVVSRFPNEFVITETRQGGAYVDSSVSNYKIPYHYFLESYYGDGPLLDRRTLTYPNGTVELLASCFDWEVEEYKLAHPSGPATSATAPGLKQYARSVLDPNSPFRLYPGLIDQREVADWESMQWGDDPENPGTATHRRVASIFLDYDMDAPDDTANDKITIRLRNHPEDGSFERVFLVVEETPGMPEDHLPPIRTTTEVGMIGLEYHLPPEYFKYQQDCLMKAIGILQ